MRGQVLAAGLALLLASCAFGSTPSLSGTVEVLGSWTGEELAAFRAALAPWEERTGVSVDYSSTRDLTGVLQRRIAAGSPPDLAGLAGPAQMRELARSGALKDLGDVLDLGAYRSEVAPTFIELGTVDGRLVGIFLRSTVKGLVWYDPVVFQLGTPHTWDELQRMAAQARDRATSEWCVGLASLESSGWPGTDLVEQFLLRQGGPDAYDEWVAGDLRWTSNEVRRAFESYGQMVAEGSVHDGVLGALRTDFGTAGAPLFSDPPGCLFLVQGSFMPAFFEEAGQVGGEDYDFFPFPELSPAYGGAVIGAGDLFGLVTDNAAAQDLMRYLVSSEAQSLWVQQGGSLSVNARVVDYPDPISQRAAELLTGADLFRFDASDLMPAAMNAAFYQAVLDYTTDQSRLNSILAQLDAVRQAAYGS